jgi:hypothetical protein
MYNGASKVPVAVDFLSVTNRFFSHEWVPFRRIVAVVGFVKLQPLVWQNQPTREPSSLSAS